VERFQEASDLVRDDGHGSRLLLGMGDAMNQKIKIKMIQNDMANAFKGIAQNRRR
jgi:hypothetical protein